MTLEMLIVSNWKLNVHYDILFEYLSQTSNLTYIYSERISGSTNNTKAIINDSITNFNK
jgi:hypothetical protein